MSVLVLDFRSSEEEEETDVYEEEEIAAEGRGRGDL